VSELAAARSPQTGVGFQHSRAARTAVGLPFVFGLTFLGSVGTIAMFYVVGAEKHVEDTWLALLLVAVAAVSLLGCAAAFLLAIRVRVKGEQWNMLWIPLSTFPVLAGFVLIWGMLPGT
jgi:hypothetical protein